ncbi:hypothetical protein DA100_09210 [Vibrio sp. Hep-1b-8]|nr:hypothetical protein DA100_09210 [Vibrio sp. Hep-1b-8]
MLFTNNCIYAKPFLEWYYSGLTLLFCESNMQFNDRFKSGFALLSMRFFGKEGAQIQLNSGMIKFYERKL